MADDITRKSGEQNELEGKARELGFVHEVTRPGTEVEAALYEHPDVMDASVVGIPHRQLGEEPAAAVTLKVGSTATELELREFVRARLAGFKVPVRVLISVGETLPRNANGKILKAEVKKMLLGDA